MAAPNPEFTESFQVQTGNYGDFIRVVRQNVIEKCDDRRPGIVQPVLPPEQKVPRLWFHVVLRTTATSSLTLAVRMDNLYLFGFMTPAGAWWEFNNEDGISLIPGSKWLGFGGRYQDLVGQKGLESATLGRAQMATAVDVLAKHGTTKVSVAGGQAGDPYAVPKSMLAKLVIMVCEGVRFHTVYGTVDRGFDSAAVTVTVTETEGKQVNKWDRISAAVFGWAKEPGAKFPDLEKVGVKDKNDAARIVALVKHQAN